MDHSPQGWEKKPSHAVAIPQKRFPRSINPAKKVAGENNFRSSGSRVQSQASLSYAEMKERRRSQDFQDLRRQAGKRKLDLWITVRRAGRKTPRSGENPHRTQEIISQPFWAEILEIKFGFMDYSPQGWEKNPAQRRKPPSHAGNNLPALLG